MLALTANPNSIDYSFPADISYVDVLFYTGQIDDRIFSLAMYPPTQTSATSVAHFGYADTSFMDGDPVYFSNYKHSFYGEGYWSTVSEGVRFRNSSLTYDESVDAAEAFATYGVFTVLNSGEGYFRLPTPIYNFVIPFLLRNLTMYGYASESDLGYIMYCSEIPLLPVIDIFLNGYWLEILPKDYAHVRDDSGTICGLAIESSSSVMVLGVAAMSNYYTIHNQGNMSFGIVPLANSDTPKQPLTEGTRPSTYFNDDPFVVDRTPAWIYMAIMIPSGLAILFLINYLLYVLVIENDTADTPKPSPEDDFSKEETSINDFLLMVLSSK